MAGAKPAFKQEELDQILAPIALYPDSLLTQILMASTYPLEVVQADRWAKKNKDMKGDALAKALEAQTWDPSVKSLVNFPTGLADDERETRLDAEAGRCISRPAKRCYGYYPEPSGKGTGSGQPENDQGAGRQGREKRSSSSNLPARRSSMCRPITRQLFTAAWAYPAYPPYPVYPPGYTAGAAFVTGVAVGAAWGYAWGHSNWHGGDVNVNSTRIPI